MGKHKKLVSRTGAAILCLVVAAAAILLVLHVFAVGGRALPGGYRPLAVLSGSMEPAVPVGGIVLTKSIDPARVEVGDVITFALTPDMTGQVHPFATHRVVRVVEGDTGRSFVTKGDANIKQDPSPVPAAHLIGRVVLVVPYVGYLTSFVQSPMGLVLLILLPGAILVMWEGIDLIRRRSSVLETVGVVILVLVLCFVGAGQAGTAAGATDSAPAQVGSESTEAPS
ncbi:MAG TPA: signal peptidase I, partial [Thermoleophilia bacterium]|nr:signal peptidase I [Thermoleophilia bacterium]